MTLKEVAARVRELNPGTFEVDTVGHTMQSMCESIAQAIEQDPELPEVREALKEANRVLAKQAILRERVEKLAGELEADCDDDHIVCAHHAARRLREVLEGK